MPRRTKLSDEQRAAIRADPRSQREIAADYSVCQQTIGHVKNGRRQRTRSERRPEGRRQYLRNRSTVIARATAWNEAHPDRRSEILARHYERA